MRQWTAVFGWPEDPAAGEEVDLWARTEQQARAVELAWAGDALQTGAYVTRIGPMEATASAPVILGA